MLLARGIALLTVVAIGAGLTFAALDRQSLAQDLASSISFLVAFVAFPITGYVLASRRPDNSISWLLAGIGLVFAIDICIGSYSEYALRGGLGGLQAGRVVAGIEGPLWVPIVAIPATFLILLFPDGHLPSSRWRWFAWTLGASLVIVYLAIMLAPGKLDNAPIPVDNPLGQEWLRPALPFVLGLIALLPIAIVASLVSLVRRYRRSVGTERLQLRWLVTAAVIVAVLYGIALPIGLVTGWDTNTTPLPISILESVAILSFALIPVSIGIAVLRYRLLDIDLVISRALLFGALAIFITAVYVALVVGVGALLGGRADPVLSAAAAATVALAFQPARRRAQRLADRLVFGKRATPYEVLSEFSDRIGSAFAVDDLLPKMARALADGTGAVRSDVWVRVGERLRPEGTWPSDAEPIDPIDVSSVGDGTMSAGWMLEPVRHDGRLLGALSVRKRPGEQITPSEERLVRDLAGQAGLVMSNVALTEQLKEHIEQLRASRQRLVSAQDEERRKLERNLHDGAQQQLVAVAVKLRLLQQLIGRDSDRAASMAGDLQGEVTTALEDLRDLARGIYPPLLADKGLLAALESQARRSPIPVSIGADGIGRYPREVESAVYFSCLEALQNVAKYAQATSAAVELSDGAGRLRFEVSDDGVGFDADRATYGSGLQGMADRLSAIGGELRIRSTAGAGTTVTGEIPVVMLVE